MIIAKNAFCIAEPIPTPIHPPQKDIIVFGFIFMDCKHL